MKRLSRIEKLCVYGILILACVIALALSWLALSRDKEEKPDADQTAGLAVPESYLPQNLILGENPPAVTFSDADGNAVPLSDLYGTPILMIFWSSWCPHCEAQMEIAPAIAETASQYGAKVLLIDKFDPEKETKEAALNAFTALGSVAADFTLLFDEGLAAYDAWGLMRIPTSIVLDVRGRAAALETSVLTKGEVAGLFDRALNGGDLATARFIAASLTNAGGGVMMNLGDALGVPGGHDVLSESQGILMQYALLKGDRSLFDSAYGYVKEHMMVNGLVAWYATEDGKLADSDAVIDDLRIWSTLLAADQLWGGYSADERALRDAIYDHCVRGVELVDFYEFSSGKMGDTLSLHSADIAALQALAEVDARFEQAAKGARATLEGGYISDEFPLYYGSYDYSEGTYSHDDLNISEALYTLLNLAKADLLPDASLNWLRARVGGEGLAARYRVDGGPVKGYAYHSTAPYALVALIAIEVGDRQLYTDAISKMQRYRIDDMESACYGAFGDAESGDFPAFDQLIPLLAYASDSTRGK